MKKINLGLNLVHNLQSDFSVIINLCQRTVDESIAIRDYRAIRETKRQLAKFVQIQRIIKSVRAGRPVSFADVQRLERAVSRLITHTLYFRTTGMWKHITRAQREFVLQRGRKLDTLQKQIRTARSHYH